MSQRINAVVALGKGRPVSVETVVVPDPGHGEVVVQVQACGVCHTDLHYRDGGITGDFPFLLGHEAAGLVESVGTSVTEVAPGDFVVLNWRAVCGQCRACRIVAVDVDDRKLHTAARFGATHTRQQQPLRRGREDPGVHRRVRGGRRHRRRRTARDLAAGVLRPRPRRHRGAGRRPDAGHGRPGDPADRLLRPGRRPEVLVVRRLPPLTGLPDARRPAPAGPAPPGEVRAEEIGLADVETAFEKMHHGDVLRSVVVL